MEMGMGINHTFLKKKKIRRTEGLADRNILGKTLLLICIQVEGLPTLFSSQI